MKHVIEEAVLGVIVYTTQGLIVILLVPLLIIYHYYYKRFGLINNGLTHLEAFTRSPIYIHFSQTMLGLQSIRVYRCQQLFIVKLEEMIAKNILASVMQAIAIQWVSLRLSLIGALIIYLLNDFEERIDAGEKPLRNDVTLTMIGHDRVFPPIHHFPQLHPYLQHQLGCRW